VATRELRNKTADLLRRVEAGESMVITVRGKRVATLSPYRDDDTPRWMPRDELIELLKTHSADPGLRDDLRRLDETTDEDGLDQLW
jgi:prevent-host-death family protein